MAELANGALVDCCNAAVFIIGTGVGGGTPPTGSCAGCNLPPGSTACQIPTPKRGTPRPEHGLPVQHWLNLLKWYRARKALPEDAPLDGCSFFAAANAGSWKLLGGAGGGSATRWRQIYNLTVLAGWKRWPSAAASASSPCCWKACAAPTMDCTPPGRDKLTWRVCPGCQIVPQPFP